MKAKEHSRLATAAQVLMCGGLLLLGGCGHHDSPTSHGVTAASAPPAAAAEAFASPEAAVQALTDALRSEDTSRLLKMVGSEGQDIILSGDAAADRQSRQEFLRLYDQKHSLMDSSADKRTLVIGDAQWPFPVPIVRSNQGWSFDSSAGKEEILNRRIGKNEISAIQVCAAIADAQREFALRNPDHDVHEYAQQFASDPGKRNGLFWPTQVGEEPSPLGELAAAASAEGYSRRQSGLTPYHGYYYRILRAQGPHAPGGAVDYVVNHKMTLGFAVVAYPADYGNSGIMTFLMGPDGRVFQKDLGEKTQELAAALQAFDPDATWKPVQEADAPPRAGDQAASR